MRVVARRRYEAWPLVALACLLVWPEMIHHGLSGDVYWQWAAGRWMLNHGQVIRRDVFSYTLHGHAWVADEWGFEVLLAAAVRLLGRPLFWVLAAGLADLALGLTWVSVRREGADGAKAGLLTIWAAVSLIPFVRDRPQVLSYAFWALLLYLTRGLDRSGSRPVLRIGLTVPLLWVWVQCHGSFLLGFAYLALECLTSSAGLRRIRIGALAAAGLVSGLNPFGFGLWGYVFRVATDPLIGNQILEWQSPNFHDPLLLITIALPALALAVALGVIPKPVRWSGMALWSGLTFLASLHSVRFLPYFALTWVLWAAAITPRVRIPRPHPLVMTAAGAVAGALLIAARPVVPPGRPAISEPVAAVSYLATLPPGRVFAAYDWGGYLIWHHVPVFIDGRTDFYLADGILTQYLQAMRLTLDPDIIFDRWRVRYVLWPPATPLATFLDEDPSWRLIDQTRTAWLFRHVGTWAAHPVQPVGGT